VGDDRDHQHCGDRRRGGDADLAIRYTLAAAAGLSWLLIHRLRRPAATVSPIDPERIR
jgi:hypothetical protein